MKKLFAFCLALAVLLSLAACGQKDKEEAGQPTAPAESSPTDTAPAEPAPQEPEESEQPAIDYEAVYGGILEKTCAIVSAPSGEVELDEGETGLYEAVSALGEGAADAIGYVLSDINGDGVQELLIGAFAKDEFAHTKNEIYALYTCAGGQPVLVLEGRSRNAYSLMDGGAFYHYGSAGAMYSIFGEYELTGQGELLCKDYYFTYETNEDKTEIGYFHNNAGEWDPEVSKQLELDEAAFWQLEEALAARTVKLEYTAFSTMAADENEVAPPAVN